MIKVSRIYENSPDLPERYYYVRIVETVPGHYKGKDVVQVQFAIADNHHKYAGTELWSNLYLTAAASYVLHRFMEAFRLDAKEDSGILGRHARIRIKHKRHNGTAYSEVWFCAQTAVDRARAAALEKAFRERLVEEKKSKPKPKRKPERWIEPDMFEDMD